MGLLDSVFGGGDGPEAPDPTAATRIAEQYPDPSGVGTETSLGSTTWTPGVDGAPGSYSTQLSDPMKRGQGAFFNMGAGTMNYLQQYSPEQFAQNYFGQLQALRQPGEQATYSRLQDKLQRHGRGGFATGTGSTVDAQMNPELAAFYSAQQQQLSQDALRSEQLAFSRFDDLLARASGSYDTAAGFERGLNPQGAMGRSYQSGADQMVMKKGDILQQGMIADQNAMREYEMAQDEDDGFFGNLLTTGLGFAADYFLPGSGSLVRGAVGSGSSGSARPPADTYKINGGINNPYMVDFSFL